MKRLSVLGVLTLWVIFPSMAQLTLESCWEKAEQNYPMIRQRGLIQQTREFSLVNAARGYIPQLSLSAKATYQSEVPTIPIPEEVLQRLGMNGFDAVSKFQYQTVVQLDQTIWDGGQIATQREQTRAQAEVDQSNLNVSLYGIRSNVCNIYLGLLLLDEQLTLNRLMDENLRTNYDATMARFTNGVAQQSDLDAVKVELLNNKQRRVEIEAQRSAYRRVLSVMIGEVVDEQTRLMRPVALPPSVDGSVRRPELELYAARRRQIDAQKSMIDTKSLPRIGLYLQGGAGNPGLNMLKSGLSPFYLGGIRLSWTFGGLYTRGNELKQLELNRQTVDVQQEAFLWNLSLQTSQQRELIRKYQLTMEDDQEIISLRQRIRESSEVKLAHGTLSMSDFLRDVNAENTARQQKVMHEMQYLMSIYDLKMSVNE